MKKTIKVNDIILTKMDARYYFMLTSMGITKRSRGLLADSYLPTMVAKEIAEMSISKKEFDVYKHRYCLSERTRDMLGSHLVPIQDIITMLGYTKTDISKLLSAVKRKEIQLAIVGAGGTGSNFVYWLSQMCNFTGKTEIFKIVSIYDDDKFDTVNMFRIPYVSNQKKFTLPHKVNAIPTYCENIAQIFQRFPIRYDVHAEVNEKMILYGAPDLRTRANLSASNLRFIAATHKEDEFQLIENPEIDTDIQIETYGKVNVSVFFINQIKMTIRFMQYLRDTDLNGEQETNNVIAKEDMFRSYNPTTGEILAEQNHAEFKSGSKYFYVEKAREHRNTTEILPREEE